MVESRQTALQCQCGQHQGGSGDRIHQAPVAQAGKQAGHGARQQDAQQQATHQRADHATAMFRRGQRGRERHQHLGDHGEQAGDGGAHQQPGQ